MQTNKQTRGKVKSRPRHSAPRPERGRDRRAEKRVEHEALTIVLHPALFERRLEVA
jgi:hypothetical protein